MREELFINAISKNGNLENGEIFTFTPILAVGGAEEIDYLQKGDANVYQQLVFQMTS